MSMISPLKLIGDHSISCALAATAVVAYRSAPILLSEFQEGKVERSVKLLDDFGWAIGAISLVAFVRHSSRLFLACRSLDAMEALSALRKAGLTLCGGGLVMGCWELASGLREGKPWARGRQFLLGHREVGKLRAKDTLQFWKAEGASVYPIFALLSERQLVKAWSGIATDQRDAMLKTIGKENLFDASSDPTSNEGEEEGSRAIDACWQHMREGDLQPLLDALGVKEHDEDALQRAFETMGIVSDADFNREFVDPTLRGEKLVPDILTKIRERRGVSVEEPLIFSLPYLLVWALGTMAMAQQSLTYFVAGIAAGLCERGVQGRETSTYEWGEIRVVALPFWLESITSDLKGGRKLGVRSREVGLVTYLGELFHPEISRWSSALLTVPLSRLTGGDGLRGAILLSSFLAGRGFLHTLAETREELTTPPSQG
jgi:hypothetical protein